MKIASLILEFLGVLLSPAPVAAVVTLTLVFFYKESIKALLARVATIRFPGGEVSINSQSARDEADPLPKGATPESFQIQVKDDQAPNFTLDHHQQQQLASWMQAQRSLAFYWEYRYLGYFLAPTTQRVLSWFAGLPQSTTLQMFDAFWNTAIGSAKERSAIISALETHHLIQLKGDLIEITEKGREYIRFRDGAAPQAQQNA